MMNQEEECAFAGSGVSRNVSSDTHKHGSPEVSLAKIAEEMDRMLSGACALAARAEGIAEYMMPRSEEESGGAGVPDIPGVCARLALLVTRIDTEHARISRALSRVEGALNG